MLGNTSHSSASGFSGVRQCLRNEGQFVRDDRCYGQPECDPAHQSNGRRYLPRDSRGQPVQRRQGK